MPRKKKNNNNKSKKTKIEPVKEEDEEEVEVKTHDIRFECPFCKKNVGNAERTHNQEEG